MNTSVETRGLDRRAAQASHWFDEVVPYIPSLRAYACNLTANYAEADDLVQETLLKAFAHQNQFRPGSNRKAWLFIILRNTFRTNYRKRRREQEVMCQFPRPLGTEPTQDWTLQVKAVHRALQRLPKDQRKVLNLVVIQGWSYEEAAEVCDCALGTVKSRVNRGRNRLLQLLGADGADSASPAAM